MATLQFPSNPYNGQIYTYGDRRYQFENGIWRLLSTLLDGDMPIGVPFPTLEETVRDNAVEIDGSLITDGAVDFPIVAELLPWMVVSGGHLQLPDFRGMGIRGWDHGAGVDPDAASRSARAGDGQTGDYVGTVQDDGAPDITGDIGLRKNSNGVDWGFNMAGAFFDNGNLGSGVNTAYTTGGAYSPQRVSFAASVSNAKYNASEVRGKNVNVMWQMRMF